MNCSHHTQLCKCEICSAAKWRTGKNSLMVFKSICRQFPYLQMRAIHFLPFLVRSEKARHVLIDRRSFSVEFIGCGSSNETIHAFSVDTWPWTYLYERLIASSFKHWIIRSQTIDNDSHWSFSSFKFELERWSIHWIFIIWIHYITLAHVIACDVFIHMIHGHETCSNITLESSHPPLTTTSAAIPRVVSQYTSLQ